MKKNILLLILSFLIISTPFTVKANDDQPPAPVIVDNVTAQDVTQKVQQIGYIVTKNSGSLASQLDGMVEDVYVRVGDKVKQGDILIQLKKSRLNIEKEKRFAELEERKHNILKAKNELKRLMKDLKRFKNLKKSAAFNQAKYDEIEANVKIAESNLSVSKALVKKAQANFDQILLDIEDSEIKAPYDGIISQIFSEVGTYIRKGTPTVNIVNNQDLEVEVNVPAKYIEGLKVGHQYDAKINETATISTTLRAIVPEENTRTRTCKARFSFNANPEHLAVNQTVYVYLNSQQKKNILLVHKDAVFGSKEVRKVFLVEKDKAQLKYIKTGASYGNKVQVLSGVNNGDKVVIYGNERLREGQSVKITEK